MDELEGILVEVPEAGIFVEPLYGLFVDLVGEGAFVDLGILVDAIVGFFVDIIVGFFEEKVNGDKVGDGDRNTDGIVVAPPFESEN